MARNRNPLKMLARLAADDEDDEKPSRPRIAADIEAHLLRCSLRAFNTRHVFESGMIVRQKTECETFKNFGDNGVYIVIEFLAEPIIAGDNEIGSSGFRCTLDLIVAERAGDRPFQIFYVDSRRFEPVPELQEERFP